MILCPNHDGHQKPSCDLCQRNYFSLVEIVVTVLILSILITFSTLQFKQSHRPEQLQETARQLSHFLRSSAQRSALNHDEHTILSIDREQGTFNLLPSFQNLDHFKLPDGISIEPILGAEGNMWDGDIVEIPIPTYGLQESLQITLSTELLEPWTLTWKLKGLVCTVDQTPEIHWPVSVERF